jgi:acyl-[acyl-carrier-protein]-phospholipid O-acyltransferase / long-chain-fatty-acid--[acyl-carrier-protein] ligase
MPNDATSRPLWSIRGIVPFFAVGFLGAFNLVGLQALLGDVVLESIPSGTRQDVAQALVQALILAPFVLFFTPAAFLSDKWAKDRVVRWTSGAALALSVGLVVSFQAGCGIGAFAILFLLSVLAAIFSPSKYGLIKEIAGNRKLAEATAVVLALTVAAGLAAKVFYTVLFDLFHVEGARGVDEIVRQIRWASWPLLVGAIGQWLLARRVPEVGVTDHRMRFSWERYLRGRSLAHGLKDAWKRLVIRQAIIGLSMFFAVAQILVANIGAYVRETSGQASPVAISAILAAAAVGLAAGAIYAARLSRNFIETGLVPTGAAGISVLMFILPYATQA